MERDVEMELTATVASLTAKLDAVSDDLARRIDHVHADGGRRIDEVLVEVRRIAGEWHATNGRVGRMEERVKTLFRGASSQSPAGTVTLSQLKLYVAIALGAATLGIGACLWVLQIAGKL